MVCIKINPALIFYLFGVGGATVLLGSPPAADEVPLVGEATLLRRTLR